MAISALNHDSRRARSGLLMKDFEPETKIRAFDQSCGLQMQVRGCNRRFQLADASSRLQSKISTCRCKFTAAIEDFNLQCKSSRIELSH